MDNIDYENDPMIGQVFGDLTVLKRLPADMRNGRIHSLYLVQCTCGAKFKCIGRYLRNGSRTKCAYCSGEWERPVGY